MHINAPHINQIYFLGIGGIGMSALAFHFLKQGKNVLGYDKTKTELCKTLEEAGAKIEYDFNLDLAKSLSKAHSIVIYTPAIKEDQPIFSYFIDQHFFCVKRAKVLGEISKDKTCIAIAGTHGKTTITCMLGHILKGNNEPVTVFAGGISDNYNSNYIYNGDDIYVVEADEFDKSFLNLTPDFAVISNVDADHLDIYSSKENIDKSFEEFAALVKDKAKLFHDESINFGGKTIGLETTADSYAKNIRIESGTYLFDFHYNGNLIKDVELKIPGKHNLFNALCALNLAIAYNPDKAKAYAKALSTFSGVRRRFNYIVKTEEYTVIDDYAHHPTEINAVFTAIKEMHPGKKTMVIFQPHLFSRTRDFMNEFAEFLSGFDTVRLLDIYPAREKPIENISAHRLLELITSEDKKIIPKSEIYFEILEKKHSICALLGAGDIGVEAQIIKQQFNNV
jgi:UDP-N-acetylmuramate--alanine ligase